MKYPMPPMKGMPPMKSEPRYPIELEMDPREMEMKMSYPTVSMGASAEPTFKKIERIPPPGMLLPHLEEMEELPYFKNKKVTFESKEGEEMEMSQELFEEMMSIPREYRPKEMMISFEMERQIRKQIAREKYFIADEFGNEMSILRNPRVAMDFFGDVP